MKKVILVRDIIPPKKYTENKLSQKSSKSAWFCFNKIKPILNKFYGLALAIAFTTLSFMSIRAEVLINPESSYPVLYKNEKEENKTLEENFGTTTEVSTEIKSEIITESIVESTIESDTELLSTEEENSDETIETSAKDLTPEKIAVSAPEQIIITTEETISTPEIITPTPEIITPTPEIVNSTSEIAISTPEIALEPKIESLPTLLEPSDFPKLKGVYAVIMEAVAVIVEKSGVLEFWLHNMISGNKQRISTDVAVDFPIGLKDGFLFWLSQNRATIYAYCPKRNEYFSQPVPVFDSSRGERARIDFPEISWQVIVSNYNFYFFSQETGEVFSDESSSAREKFGIRNNFHKFISEEQMGYLGFMVEPSIDELNVY